MNITDIDDKIIRRARWNYLLESYGTEERGLKDILDDVNEAVKVEITYTFNLIIDYSTAEFIRTKSIEPRTILTVTTVGKVT